MRVLTEDEIAEEVSFIQTYQMWPLWPVLPVKNINRGDGRLGDEGIGIMVAGEGPKVYLKNLLELHEGPLSSQLEGVRVLEFETMQDLVRAGWVRLMSLKDYPSQEAYGRHGYVVINSAGSMHLPDPIALRQDEYLIIRDCPVCGKESRVIVPGKGLWEWEHGAFVQNAFPDSSAGEREQVITGMHTTCFDDVVYEPKD